MKISELTIRQGNVEVEGTIKEVSEPRTFNRFDRELKVADAVLEDDSGTIRLSLWNENADEFKAGDKVKVINGYVNEFQGEKQLTAGKFGKIEKVGEGEDEGEKTEKAEETEEPKGFTEEVKEKVEDVVEKIDDTIKGEKD